MYCRHTRRSWEIGSKHKPARFVGWELSPKHFGLSRYFYNDFNRVQVFFYTLRKDKIDELFSFCLIAARQESHRLREQVDSTITESANSMWRSWNESNDALRTRIAETTEAHTRLQYHLSRTKQEIYDQEKHIWALKRAIRDKEAPLKVWFCILLSHIKKEEMW